MEKKNKRKCSVESYDEKAIGEQELISVLVTPMSVQRNNSIYSKWWSPSFYFKFPWPIHHSTQLALMMSGKILKIDSMILMKYADLKKHVF